MSLTYEGELVSTSEATYLQVRFYDTVKYSSLTDDKFTFTRSGATPGTVPLNPIEIEEDYNDISRILRLYPAATLAADTTYQLAISGLKDVLGDTLPDGLLTFEIGDEAVVVVEPTPDPVIVTDNSLVVAPFTVEGEGGVTTSSTLTYLSSDPVSGSFYLDSDYGKGIIAIQFSADISLTYVNDRYFKAQRKAIQRKPLRWESVPVLVYASGSEPIVYVSFPSNDATPVYGQVDKTYFEDNYEYRIIVSKNITT